MADAGGAWQTGAAKVLECADRSSFTREAQRFGAQGLTQQVVEGFDDSVLVQFMAGEEVARLDVAEENAIDEAVATEDGEDVREFRWEVGYKHGRLNRGLRDNGLRPGIVGRRPQEKCDQAYGKKDGCCRKGEGFPDAEEARFANPEEERTESSDGFRLLLFYSPSESRGKFFPRLVARREHVNIFCRRDDCEDRLISLPAPAAFREMAVDCLDFGLLTADERFDGSFCIPALHNLLAPFSATGARGFFASSEQHETE